MVSFRGEHDMAQFEIIDAPQWGSIVLTDLVGLVFEICEPYNEVKKIRNSEEKKPISKVEQSAFFFVDPIEFFAKCRKFAWFSIFEWSPTPHVKLPVLIPRICCELR